MAFIDDEFLLEGETARRLYKTHAIAPPILDYHCHLSPREIADNRRFRNLFELWLEGDHYKWRAMRANGIAERYCTGDADPFEKFHAWAGTVPRCLRNPLYQWTHLELRRYFGIDELLDATSARRIWDRANELLQSDGLVAHGILAKFRVKALCTTDDPAEDLASHRKIRDSGLETRVYPTFRPDRAFDVHLPETINPWLDRLGARAGVDVRRLSDLLDALQRRHDAFHAEGGRLSDHGLDRLDREPASDAEAAAIFDRARAGHAASADERAKFTTFLMLHFARLDAAKGWTKQLHLGARRNVSTRALAGYGRDGGFDTIGDWPQVEGLAAFFDRLDREHVLPRTIVYNVNPSDNYAFATMIGNFQDGEVPGKIQFGSAWWFLDQKQGIEWQLDALSNTGLLSRFVGMITDSRSFMSYPRHEYFRRVLCNLLGRDVDRGELPDHDDLLGGLIQDVCYGNAERFLRLGEDTHA
jgi:glucuronate isomerase